MKIAVIGTGLMGSGLVKGLLKSGHEVVVYNRTEAKILPLIALGAKAAESISDAINNSDASILVLTDGKSLRNVLLAEDVKDALKGKKILNASTTTPADIAEIEMEVSQLGGRLAEMSIMVGADSLLEAEGYYILGCSDEDDTFWTKILDSIGTVVRVGKTGDASKAEQPMLFASMFMNIATAYAAAVTTKLQLPDEVKQKFISEALPGSEYVLPNMLTRNYDAVMASVEGFQGVAASAISSSQKLGIPTKILEAMQELYLQAEEKGYKQNDGSAIFEVLMNE